MQRFFIFLLALALTMNVVAAREKHRVRKSSGESRERAERRDGRLCLDHVRGLGTQWIGEQGALDGAKKDWMERVRYYHGETYVDMSHAGDVVKRCGRVSIGEVAGQVLYRCEIEARPCKAGFEPQGGGAK
jgi:hypothetical protein